ncbi:S49 family peptidase, partial [Pseudomonas aeruginosa]|uniref:S49 family peptidase n=1 Tax=Pseudomonas aeruginosa TaxID=287 RepID=UPI003969427A
MSELIARQVLGRLNMTEALVSVHGIPEVAADLRALSLADARQENAKAEESKASLLAAYGFEETGAQKPFAFAAGIAVIPVHGSLINRFGASWGYVTGYNFIRSQLNAALADDDVKAVVFDCNSYGGEAAGCFELADEIYAARGRKPLTAVVDSNCYSACYAIASACDRVHVTPTGGAASIGVVAMHISFERALENIGLKVELIYAGAHKVDGNPFSDLPDNVRANIQRGVDKSRDDFVAAVARNRGLDKQVVRDTEAACYRADEALAIGLIDAVSTPTQAVATLLSELSGSTDNQENTMSVQPA